MATADHMEMHGLFVSLEPIMDASKSRIRLSFAAVAVSAALALGNASLSCAAETQAKAQPEAIAALLDLGSVLIRTDGKQPGRPVVAVDFDGNSDFKDTWLQYLAAFPKLQDLNLGATALTDAGIEHIRKLQELETLNLSKTKITDAGLGGLKGLARLRRLDIRGTAATAAGITDLRKALPKLTVAVDGPVRDPAFPPNTENPVDKPSTAGAGTFAVEKIVRLRDEAAKFSEMPEDTPQGWTKSKRDPAGLVKIFQPLRLRRGYVVRAYQFREDVNGNAVVWAMPADSEFPEPQDCPILEAHLLKAPKPSEALDDVMEAIEGDDSPASYVMASLLRRQFLEFGAMSHGVNWSMHFVIGADPWNAAPPKENEPPYARPNSLRDQWTWSVAEPKDWTPTVKVEDDCVTVTFYTFCALMQERIYRHTDTYKRGKYRPKVEQKQIAEGQGGVAL